MPNCSQVSASVPSHVRRIPAVVLLGPARLFHIWLLTPAKTCTNAEDGPERKTLREGRVEAKTQKAVGTKRIEAAGRRSRQEVLAAGRGARS